MSSLSPRGSLSGASSAPVSEDFRDSLKDLTQNNKYEISNLTIIAKESTEHAQAISKVLETHIKKAGPSQKLPALYLLDSIVKNVGTPYTVYLGRSLYSTFMEAYTMVDGSTRKSMEGMLKTWKDPVPGSMDPRPVFPPEVSRPIETALIRARTAALQHRPGAQAGYQSTPTPPQPNGQFAPPGHGQFQQHQQFYRQQPTPQQTQPLPVFQSTPVPQQAQLYGQPPQAGAINVETIKRDLVGIIAQAQREFGYDPMNQKTQAKLQALLSLQHVLNTQQLSQQHLQAVAAQMSQLSASATPMPQPRATPPVVSTPQWQPPVPVAQVSQTPALPFIPPPSAQANAYAHPPPPKPSQTPSLNPQQLGSLAALLQNTQKPSTPQIRAAAPALEHVPHAQVHNIQTQTAAAPPPQSGADLFAALAKAGLVKPPPMPVAAPTPSAPPPAAAPPADLATLLNSLHKRTASQNNTPTGVPLAGTISGRPHIPPTNASLKVFRPELLRALYTDQPNQCVPCGRRFLSTPEGRSAKARHLDFHFRINARLAESSRATHHRHWFSDAVTWMQTEESDDSTAAANTGNAEKVKKPEDMYVTAPPGTTKTTCPICYEEMRSSHPEELDDWVFMNAQYNGGRIVHATCLAEMTGGVAGLGGVTKAAPGAGSSLAAALASLGGSKAREGSRTPDSVLGKRKAEDGGGSAGKMRREF